MPSRRDGRGTSMSLGAEIEHRALDTWEIAPRLEVERMQQRLLADQLRYVSAASWFYRSKLGALGGEVNADVLAELPFTTKDDLRRAQSDEPPFGSLQAANRADIVRLHVTSGTTGRPLAIGFTREDLRISSSIGARVYWAAGVDVEDVFSHRLNYSLYVGGLADHLALEQTGATVVPVGLGQSERILELWNDLRPTGLYSTPSYARHLAEIARRQGVEPRSLGLRLVLGGGEPGGDIPETRALIEETWGAQVGDIYGLGEVWPTFAGHCAARDGLHLSAPDALFVELIDPDSSGDPVEMSPGAEGELVYTHLRYVPPLSSDIEAGTWFASSIPAVAVWTTPRLRILGRSDAMFIVRGVNVFPQAIEGILDELVPSHGAFAVLLREPQPVPPVPLLVEAAGGSEDLADTVQAAIRTRLQFTCQVSFVGAGALALQSEHKSRSVFRTYQGEQPPGLEHEGAGANA